MNYVAHYDRLIALALGRVIHGYVERHHVVPRCIGGGDEPSNIVRLTAEEHYVAHQLLVKINPGNADLAVAAVFMGRRGTGNKLYGWLRKRHSVAQRKKKLSAEHRRKIGDASRGIPRPGHGAKVSAALRGVRKSAEHVAKMAAAKIGFRHSAASKLKMSVARRGVSFSTEHRLALSKFKLRYWAERKAREALVEK